MTDRPILFSAPMVRAILDGRKTQTRRVLKEQPPEDMGLVGVYAPGLTAVFGYIAPTNDFKVPLRYKPGDRLWVREAHALLPLTAYRGSIGTGTIAQTEHPTDGYSAAVYREGFDRSGRPLWRPSIHMPRWASRITLIVTDVRVERLQDISEEDAEAEGIERLKSGRGYYDPTMSKAMVRASCWHRKAEHAFEVLWDSINGMPRKPGGPDISWKANPWVVAISFKPITKNIDQIEGGE